MKITINLTKKEMEYADCPLCGEVDDIMSKVQKAVTSVITKK